MDQISYSCGLFPPDEHCRFTQVFVDIFPVRGVRVTFASGEEPWVMPVDDLVTAYQIAEAILCLRKVDMEVVRKIVEGESISGEVCPENNFPLELKAILNSTDYLYPCGASVS